MRTPKHVLCANFVKFGWPEISKVVRYLPHQKNKTSALASARIAPKICQGQLHTIYSELPKFHPNPFTSSGVTAERVNIVQTRHKVFPILRRVISYLKPYSINQSWPYKTYTCIHKQTVNCQCNKRASRIKNKIYQLQKQIQSSQR